MGEGNPPSHEHIPLDESSPCAPTTPYGVSKREAEALVLQGNYVPEPVVLRLTMVYGGKAKGNMSKLIAAITRRRFLPLPEFGTKRSIVHVDDVVQAVILAATHGDAPGEVFIVSDGVDYTTREMCDIIRNSLGLGCPRFAVPRHLLSVLAFVGDLIGRLRGRRFMFDTDSYDKLKNPALYSSSKIQSSLGYRPLMTLSRALPEMLNTLGVPKA
jgi:UDP-glucose 4-epimerase